MDAATIASGYAVWMAAFAAALAPPPAMDVNAWAAEERVVSAESGSPYPGRWDNDRVPYLREVQEVLSFEHPCRSVVLKKSAQVGGSEVGINWLGTMIARAGCPILVVLPTIDESKKWNKVKFQPTADATPALRNALRDLKSRDEDSSTATFKRFAGGFMVVTGANSSAGLQMISARAILFEEVSEYPLEAEGRGDPITQALARSKAWDQRRPKRFYNSTPSIEGSCRVTARFDESDQRRYYVPCPSCGEYQTLVWERLRYAETRPHKAHYVCAAHGCVIEPHHKLGMIARGVWIKTYPGDAGNPAPPKNFAPSQLAAWRARDSAGRDPGFHIWQIYSPFVHWDSTVAEYLAARDDPTALKTFWQQGLGEAWAERGEAPDHEALHQRRQDYRFGRIPLGALFLAGAADVQADRIEWDVYGWGAGLTAWLVDSGVIQGDTADDATWSRLHAVIDREYPDAWGRKQRIDAFGIDAGFRSQAVYRFVRKRGAESRTFALDGRPGWRLPALGTPSKRDVDFEGQKIGAVMLWPVGTWDLKSELYSSLRKTIAGPDADGNWPRGAYFYPQDVAPDYFVQLTAEYLADSEKRDGVVKREWRKTKSRANERHDTAVYARALAHHLADELGAEQWAALERRRTTPPQGAQMDLGALWAPKLAGTAKPPPEQEQPKPAMPAPPPAPRGIGPQDGRIEAGRSPAGRALGGIGRRLS